MLAGMRAIQITEFGGPEVLTPVELATPTPSEGQQLIDVTAAGINYADTHQSENTYLAPATLPLVPGAEAVGTTADGRRVVALLEGGGYAEQAVAWEPLMFDVPDGVDDGAALALVLQGTTAWHIPRTSAHLAAGESVVVHAAAGGVGTLAVQLAKQLGAGKVIAVASSDEKRDLAKSLGADATVDARVEDMKAALEEANDGKKVDVVLEMVGGRTFDASLAALAPFGRLVTYGMASREAAKPLHAGNLMRRSRGVIGFWLAHCMRDPDRYLAEPMRELLGMVQRGELQTVIGGTYPLSEARRAHEDLRQRRTTGKLVLDPTA
jgi:NADPH:quinone reductase